MSGGEGDGDWLYIPARFMAGLLICVHGRYLFEGSPGTSSEGALAYNGLEIGLALRLHPCISCRYHQEA